MRRVVAILFLLAGFRLFAAEVIPPAPAAYFNDYAQVVSTSTAAQLNQTLEDFERQSSDQIIVAVFPTMQSDSSIEDYTVRVARAWRVGQKDKNNGAVLFVFVQDHKMFLQTGYGLEGVLPDALCKRIIDEQISPRFKAGDFNGGLTAGVQSIIAAVKGEYKGTGMTVADRTNRTSRISGSGGSIIPIILIVLFIFMALSRGSGMFLPWLLFSGSGSNRNWGGGGFSGGSFGGGGFGGGGGFSGGGGSFGGGGAGGSW
jgi:uncharacterized protein